jgi:hypothetical protein
MNGLGSVAWDAAKASWGLLCESGPFVLAGLLAAGLVHIFISREFLSRHLGGRGFGAVVKAALVGAPLPLCSCAVLPTALALRDRGAGRGPIVSFLISTPETGVDSLAITWALLGPVMAIVRPVAAVLTAIAAGMGEVWYSRHAPERDAPAFACPVCRSNDCEHVETGGRWRRFWRFVTYGMGDDLGPTLAAGLLLGGLLTAVVPDAFFTSHLGNHWIAMLMMLAAGMVVYVCASASTPMVAALVLYKGLSPGAALVFLLVGPATNLATILMVSRMLGRGSAAIYDHPREPPVRDRARPRARGLARQPGRRRHGRRPAGLAPDGRGRRPGGVPDVDARPVGGAETDTPRRRRSLLPGRRTRRRRLRRGRRLRLWRRRPRRGA